MRAIATPLEPPEHLGEIDGALAGLQVLLVIAAVLLSGFGIYLGRFLRWNSWDTVASPHQLFPEIADRLFNPLSHPQALGVTVVYGVGLFLGYVALRFWQPAPVRGEQAGQQ